MSMRKPLDDAGWSCAFMRISCDQYRSIAVFGMLKLSSG
jgi:hypothetical protein